MKKVSVKQMKQMDAMAVEALGIPSLVLMENAGIHSAQAALSVLGRAARPKVAIFCGPGKNGGDGLVCARHLLNHGVQVKIYLVGKKPNSMAAETKANLKILTNMGASIEKIAGKTIKGKYTLIIDALLGIGLKSRVREPFFSIIEMINTAKVPVLALDVPSGLDADTGVPQGVAIRARHTVTFCAPKRGLLKKSARPFIGKLTIAGIGIGVQYLK